MNYETVPRDLSSSHSLQLAEFKSLVLKFTDFVQIQKIYHNLIDLNNIGFLKT